MAFQPMMTTGYYTSTVPSKFTSGPFEKIELKGVSFFRYFEKNYAGQFCQKFRGAAELDSITFQGFIKEFWATVGILDVPAREKL
jgi:hypothetical protein